MQNLDIAEAYFYSFDFDKSMEFFELLAKGKVTEQQKKEALINIANIYLIKSQPQNALFILNNLDDNPEVIRLKKEAFSIKEKMKCISETGYWSSEISEQHEFSKDLADWMTSQLNKSKKIYDFGCGSGYYLRHLMNNGFVDLVGYECSIPKMSLFENIICQDLSKKFSVTSPGDVICLEVGEHIPSKYQDVFLDNICNACDGTMILSWAIRGQPGLCHVNCLNNDEVIPELEKRGFYFLQKESMNARKCVQDSCHWFKDTIMVFNKN